MPTIAASRRPEAENEVSSLVEGLEDAWKIRIAARVAASVDRQK